MAHVLEAMLCTGVVFTILLITWLVHVAKREGGFWHVKCGDFHNFR